MINVARQVINNVPSVPKTDKKQETGLLQRTQARKQESDTTQPIMRMAQIVEMIKQKREGLKDG
tara:strand:- start:1016 stop:1207 length:192 start_codon:yes stop_codon:yes gene_type:complete